MIRCKLTDIFYHSFICTFIEKSMILTISWPDTYVTCTNTFYDKFFTKAGINKNNKYKAGHAALVLINPKTGILEYYDFGRYITPLGYGRVRSSETDFEIQCTVTAEFDQQGNLVNQEEIFLFLSNSKFTHGDGRMVISVIKEIDYQKAKSFIIKEQDRGDISYGPFTYQGSNCSRFVADTIIQGTTSKTVWWKTNFPLSLTPSPLGNTWNACTNNEIWSVFENKITSYSTNRFHLWKDLFSNFLEKTPFSSKSDPYIGNLKEPVRSSKIPTHATWLNGIGAGAWFTLEKIINSNEYLIERYDPYENKDLTAIFQTNDTFDISLEYKFTYPSNGKKCTILQNDKKIKFEFVREFTSVL